MEQLNPAIQIEQMASEAGLTVNELCAAAHVARTTLTRWKNGATSPNMKTMRRFEKAISDIKHKAQPKLKKPRSN